MRAPPAWTCLPFLAAACRPPGVGRPPGSDSGDSPVGSEAPIDSGLAEQVPAARADPLFDPPPGGFLDPIHVAIASSSGEGEILACVTVPSAPCTPEPVDGPFAIDASAIVIARVDLPWRTGDLAAASYVQLDPRLAEFSSNLPLLVFWTDGPAPASTAHTPTALDVFEPVAGRATLGVAADSGRARLKTRGRSTADVPKPSYDLELWRPDSEEDRGVALLGMPAEADWILQAPWYYDESLVRNAFGYAVSNRLGRYAPRTRFAELFLAPEGQTLGPEHYLGLYVVTEEVERGADRIDLVALTPEDVAEPAISGGYVFKRDQAGEGEQGFTAGHAGGAFAFDDPLVWVDPEEGELTPEQRRYLPDLVDEFAWALVSPGFTHPETGRHYAEIIDVDAWIDHHILSVLLKNPDAFRLSGYMSKDREGPIVAGPLWDLDRAAGANDYRATDPTWWDSGHLTWDTTAYFAWAWYGALFEDPEFGDRYWARWRDLLESGLTEEEILADLEALTAPLPEAAARNQERWAAADFEGQVANLRAWLLARHAWIEACVATFPDPRECQGT